MGKPLVTLIIPLLLLSTLVIGPQGLNPVHGANSFGVVCIASSTSSTCPATTPTLAGPQPAFQFRVGIFIDNPSPLSPGVNGFDIILLTNKTVLKPADAILGNVGFGSSPTTLVKCIGGVNEIGSAACPANDNASTIEYSVTGNVAVAPVTALLFTAVFNVTANNSNTPITFLTGCANSSVSGVCVSISSGSLGYLPETSLTAKFSNTAYFDIEANTGVLQVSKGDNDTSAFLTLTSLNGFGGTSGTKVNLATSFPPSGPVVGVQVSSVTLFASAPNNQTFPAISVNVSRTVLPGNYTITFTGSAAGLPPNSVTMIVEVPVPDFSLTIKNPGIVFNVTAKGSSVVSISSIGNFNGTVTLSISAPSQVNATFSNSQPTQTLKLNMKGTNSTTLSVTSKIAGAYQVNISGTSTSGVHVAVASIIVLDFMLLTPPGPVAVVQGQTGLEPVSAASVGNYNTTVAVGTIYVEEIRSSGVFGPSNGVSVGCSPSRVTLTSIGTSTGLNVTTCHVNGLVAGNYLVVVTATSGVANRTSTHAVSFQVNVLLPAFTVGLPKFTTVPIGQSATVSATIKSSAGLVDNVTMGTPTITGPSPSPPISLALNASIVRLTSSIRSVNVTVTITVGATAAAGTYNMTISGSSLKSNPTSISGSMLVIVEQVSSPHNLGILSVVPSLTSASVGQSISIAIKVQNFGRLAENATVVALVGDLSVGSKNATNLMPGANITETITWDTHTYGAGSYTIGGRVLAANGQTNTTYSTVRLANPITLTAANSNSLPSYILPLAIAVAIIIVAIAAGLFLQSRRKPAPAQ